MKNLKAFESIDWNKPGLIEDAYFWFENLEPEEMCLLLLWSSARGSLIQIEEEEVYVSDSSDSGSGSGEIEIQYKFKGGDCSVFLDFSFSGDFTRYYPATWEQPAEGGDFILKDIDVNSIHFFIDGEKKSFDVDFVNTKSRFSEEIDNLSLEVADRAIVSETHAEDSRKSIKKVNLPQEIKSKIENLSGELPVELKKSFPYIKRFGMNP